MKLRWFLPRLHRVRFHGSYPARYASRRWAFVATCTTIFQKIAASSFAAVRSTLRRRQLSLTIHEAILKDLAKIKGGMYPYG